MLLVEHCPDSFAWLKEAPTGSADVIITDPPYSEHVHANMCSGSLVGKKSVPKYELDFAPLTQYGWLADAVRVARRWVVVFCGLEDFGRFEAALPRPTYVRGCVWYKCNAMGQLTGDRPATAFEGIALFHGESVKKRWNGRGSYGIWRANGTRGKKERHPNEKPLDLAQKLVALFSEPGELVLDPFCGSAAFGEAAARLGRDYVGLDQDPAWVEKGAARLSLAYPRTEDAAALAMCSMRGDDPPSTE